MGGIDIGGTKNIPPVYLMGPTAAGKTALALAIANRFDCEIISVDSALIYRGMDIGTAKPDADILDRYPHHLVDIIDPVEGYSVAAFLDQALVLIEMAVAKKKIPLLVGGTMLYFNALDKGLAPLPASDPGVRRQLQSELDGLGLEALYTELIAADPEAATRIHRNDSQRILRALEVWRVTGVPLTDHYRRQACAIPVHTSVKLCLTCTERTHLHRQIEARFEAMVELGFIEEVVTLRSQFPTLTELLPSMRCVGYRQIWAYLEGRCNRQIMLDRGVAATRQLAKRQLTWLRGMDDLNWFYTDQKPQSAIFSLIEAAIS